MSVAAVFTDATTGALSTGAAAGVGFFSGIAAPVALTGTSATTGAVTLTWANNPLNGGNNVTGLTLSWNSASGSASKLFPATSTGATVIGLTLATNYTFSLVANSRLGTAAAAPLTVPVQ